jgi:ADP-heptose:LPS heptosyltransferase
VINKILEKEGLTKETALIGIHPGGMPSRRWPVESFCGIIEDISKRISCKFVITGGKGEQNLGQRLMRINNARIINFIDKLNLKELCALIKRCKLFITNDTGPMHIAAILKTPLVAIFGPGDIVRFDPRNISDKAEVLYQKADCAPCEKVVCKDLRCLTVITPKEAIEASLRLLQKDNY